MDRLGVHVDNLRNMIVGKDIEIPVTRHNGHIWLQWPIATAINYGQAMTCLEDQTTRFSYLDYPYYFIDVQLRQLHRRFGHPSAPKLINLLRRAGHDDINEEAVRHLTKFCYQCQKHGKSPGRFKFSLQDDEAHFNYCIVVDILYIDKEPVLYVVNEGTSF